MLVVLVTFSWLGRDARAEVTLDLVFHDSTVPSGITIVPGDASAPGCTFSGYFGTVVTGVRCMDVILKSNDDLVAFSVSVAYDSDKGHSSS